MDKCPLCDREWALHPNTDELTCFVHGRYDGSHKERMIFLAHLRGREIKMERTHG